MPNDIDEICNSLGQDLLSQLQTGRFSFGPCILRGFCPEVIGQRARNLTHSVDEESKCFTDQAFVYLCSRRGNAAQIDANFDKVEDGCLALAVGLHEQLQEKWKLSLQRLRAKCFCGGVDGGLVGQVRAGLRKAYYGTLKYLSKVLKQGSKFRHFKEKLQSILESNELGEYAMEVAKIEVEKAVDAFWKNLLELTNSEMQFLWRSWQDDIRNLAKSALETLHIQKEVAKNPDIADKMETEEVKFRSFQGILRGKIQELEYLKGLLNEPVSCAPGLPEYGYGLLQSKTILFEVDRRNPEQQIDIFQNTGQTSLHAPRLEGHALSTCIREKKSHGEDNQAGTEGANRSCRRQICIAKQNAGSRASLELPRGDAADQFAQTTLHGSRNNAGTGIVHPVCVDANTSPRKLLGSGPGIPNPVRLGSFLGRSNRKAQVLSEAESHKLQKRESNANRSRR